MPAVDAGAAQRRVSKTILQVPHERVFEVSEAELDRIKTEVPRPVVGVAEPKVPLLAGVGVGRNRGKAH